MKRTIYTCIVCPKSCCISVIDDGELSFEGYGCKKGAIHAKNEYLHPMRMLTTTVRVEGGAFSRLGVIGTVEVPKGQLRACLQEIYKITVKAPVTKDEIIVNDILGTGCDIVAAMTMNEKQ
jgi:CxxC motif-containing protein